MPHVNDEAGARRPHCAERERVVEPPIVLAARLERRADVGNAIVTLHKPGHLHVDVGVVHGADLRPHVRVCIALGRRQPPVGADGQYFPFVLPSLLVPSPGLHGFLGVKHTSNLRAG